MKSSAKSGAKSVREVEYYRKRFQNRVFAKLIDFISTEAQRDQITKKEMADRLGKDPGQLSRLLGHPSNLTLDTISDLLLALNAEADPPDIVKFSDRRAPNFMHPLIARITAPKSTASLYSDLSAHLNSQSSGTTASAIELKIRPKSQQLEIVS